VSLRAEAMEAMLSLALDAARIVQRAYETPGLKVDFKEGDDPVTAADRDANQLVTTELARRFPGIPIVAEESDPATFEGFQASPAAFFVDPLDGTREFVNRTDEFAVMIGLAEDGRPTAGAIVAPAKGRAFVAAEGAGAFEVRSDGTCVPISVSARGEIEGATCVVSRWHRPPASDALLAKLGARLRVVGSAGLKGLEVATGEADLYVQPTMAGYLWDTCAPEAIARAAGAVFTDAHGAAIDYRRARLDNHAGACVGNPILHAAALARLRG
jgi:3'(2'), 5'-bisphosphate nucleotidase